MIFKVDGYFDSKQDLTRCVQELKQSGFEDKSFEINENVRLRVGHKAQQLARKNYRLEMGVAGCGVGASLGILIGFLLGFGYLNFQFWGSAAFPSPYLSILAGGFSGAILGAILGSFVGHRIPAGQDHFLRLSVDLRRHELIEVVKFVLAEFGAIQVEVFSVKSDQKTVQAEVLP